MRTLMLSVVSLIFAGVFAQEGKLNALDSLQIEQADSILELRHDATSDLLSSIDSLKRQDSLELARLTEQYNQLQQTDDAQRAKIQRRLDSINQIKVARSRSAKQQIDSLRKFTQGVPAIFDGDTLFLIYGKLGPNSPLERGERLVEKLTAIVKEDEYKAELLKIVPTDYGADILYDQFILMTVTEKDAFWLNKPVHEVAEEYRVSINASIERYLEERGPLQTLKKIGLVILILVVLVLLVRYLNKGFTWLNKRLVEKGSSVIRGIKFKDYELLSVTRTTSLLAWLLKMIKWVVIAIIVYLSLPLLFSVFPSTKSIADKLINYISTPFKKFVGEFVGYIPELITIVVIIVITRYIVKGLRFLALEVERGNLKVPGFYPDWAKPTLNLVKFIVYAFSFVIIFPYLPGSDSPAFQGVSVFLGLLISLGSSSAIGNIIAGLVITYMRAFRKGDRVKIGETTGDVIEKTMLVTRVKTIKNEEVTIPNMAILTGHTVNYTNAVANQGLILHTTVTIGYDVAWQQVQELLINAAVNASLVEKDPPPFVLQTSLDDFYVSYQLNAYTKHPEKAAAIYSEIHKNIQEQFNAAGVEILSPHYRAERDGSDITIPKRD